MIRDGHARAVTCTVPEPGELAAEASLPPWPASGPSGHAFEFTCEGKETPLG